MALVAVVTVIASVLVLVTRDDRSGAVVDGAREAPYGPRATAPPARVDAGQVFVAA